MPEFLKYLPGGGEEQALEHLEVTAAAAAAVGAMDDEQLAVDSLR